MMVTAANGYNQQADSSAIGRQGPWSKPHLAPNPKHQTPLIVDCDQQQHRGMQASRALTPSESCPVRWLGISRAVNALSILSIVQACGQQAVTRNISANHAVRLQMRGRTSESATPFGSPPSPASGIRRAKTCTSRDAIFCLPIRRV